MASTTDTPFGTDPHALTDAAQGPPPSGLTFSVAKTLEEVLEAWRLVHDTYVRAGILDPKPSGIHTVPEAIGPQTAVIRGAIREVTVATMSAILDTGGKLPLDSAYPNELNGLRAQGCKLMELGLFADRREELARSFSAVLQLMRYATYYGLSSGATDGVIGVHPRHARFYMRYHAFEAIGEEKTYSTVKDRPVVLLRLPWAKNIQADPKPAGIRYLLENPITASQFEQRFSFNATALQGTALEPFRPLAA